MGRKELVLINLAPASSPCLLTGLLAQPNPPLWAESEMHHPILGLDTAPRPLRLMIWT